MTPVLCCTLILSMLFSLSDYQFIKCLHTTEIIRGIPGCVSILNPSLHNHISMTNINLAHVAGEGRPLLHVTKERGQILLM